MKLSHSLLVAAQALSVLALPAPNKAGQVATTSITSAAAAVTASVTSAAATATTTVATGAEDEAGAEEGAENEIEQQGQFAQVIELGGGDIKTDTKFPPGVSTYHPLKYGRFYTPHRSITDSELKTNGVFEVEFQNQEARQLRVTENKNPAAAPKGFVALEPVSYVVELGGGAAAAQGLTLQKIDYIRNAESAIDISTGQIARFCTEANAFVFGEGELEFEADENELTLTVENMVGEWAVFVPEAAAGGEAAVVEGDAGADAADDCGEGTKCKELVDAIQGLIGKEEGSGQGRDRNRRG
ncbi:hypothetical protein N0V88_002656 [Collariella sp. IMI 366227]|nr:hypothetical protein N0V88_002656 [Collariella sp. IMI 366227]